MKKIILLINLALCIAFLSPLADLGTAVNAQTRPNGKRLTPAQQRIRQYQEETALKADSIAAAKAAKFASRVKTNTLQARSKAASGAKAANGNAPSTNYFEDPDWIRNDRLYFESWNDIEDWEREEYDWDQERQAEEYRDRKETLQFYQRMIWDLANIYSPSGVDAMKGTISEMMPFFEADTTFACSKKAIEVQDKLKRAWIAINDSLETHYKNGTLTGEIAYYISNQTPEMFEKITDDMRGIDPGMDFFEMYQREYAIKYFGSVMTSQRSNCSGRLYSDNLKGNNVSSSNPSTIALAFFDKNGCAYDEGYSEYALTQKNVGGYYMIPADRPSRNPKSWYVLGCNTNEPGYMLNSAEEPEGLTGGSGIDGYDWTEPTDDRYDERTALTRQNNWIVISHVTDARLDTMQTDAQGRILFPAQKPGKFTHVMLFVTDVVGGSDNPNNNMELAGFYTNEKGDFSFSKLKNELVLDEWPRKISFGSEALKDHPELEIVKDSVILNIRHDNAYYEINDTLKLNANGELEFDFSPYHSTMKANESFPLQIGKFATAHLKYQLRNKDDGTITDCRQSVPIFVKPGLPHTYLEPLAYDGSVNGEETEYTFTVENLDPVNGAFLHIEVEDYATGKLATHTTDFSLLPSDMYLDDIDENYGGEYEMTSWLKIQRGDVSAYGGEEWQQVAAKVTAKATITVPVSCIPFARAYVSAGAANLTIEDAYGQRAWQDMFINYVHNTTFDPKMVKGTWYTYGSGDSPYDIEDWVDNDGGLGYQISADIRANIENSEVVDSLLQLERDRFTKIMNFECPVAWGDVSVKLTNDGKVVGTTGSHDNKFTLTVDFPSNNKESVLELSWQNGKIKREFAFTGHDANTTNLYCFVPIVHGDESDRVHTVTFRTDHTGKKYFRSGHFSENTAYKDNKVYICPEEAGWLEYSEVTCVLNENSFISRGSNRNVDDNGFGSVGSHQFVLVWPSPGVRCFAASPAATLMTYPETYDLRADAKTARIAVVTELGEPLTKCEIRYAYTKEVVGQKGKQLGTSAEMPLFVKAPADVNIMHAMGDNVYTIPLIQCENTDTIYNLMVEVYSSGYTSQLLCEALNGEDFRRCMETGDVYTCMLKKYNSTDRSSGNLGHNVSDVFLRDKNLHPFDNAARHFKLSNVRSMDYVGDGSNNIDVLLRTVKSRTGTVDTYVLAPYELPRAWAGAANLETTPLEGYLLAMDVANDEIGRPIVWNHDDTGFNYDYQLLTCNSQYLLPDLKKDQENPDGFWLVLWDGKRTWEDGHPHTVINRRPSNTGYQSLMWILRGFNYAEDRSEEIAGDAANCLNFQRKDLNLGGGDKKGSLGFLSTFLDGFCKLDLNGPTDCLPFSMSLTHQDDHFKLRGQFEINALDYVPVYGQYQQMNKFKMSATEFQKHYLATKNEFVSARKYKAMKIADGLNAFVGFKGFFDASLYHSDDFTSWKPYFNDLAVRLEASVSAKSPEMPLKFCEVGMALKAALYAQFMLANPSAKDPLLEGRNPLSHFNIYYTMGAGIDIEAWAEAGVDLGFIAAMAGIRGTAGASMEFTTLSRPWHPSSIMQTGMRFNVNAQLRAYARAKFLFWEKSWEKEFFKVDRTVYFPDDPHPVNGNPYQSDPNLEDGIESAAKECVIRPSFSNYSKRYSAPELKAMQVLNGIDAYSAPTYFGNDGKIAYFSLNTPNNVMDDRIVIKNGNQVTEADKDNCAALSFSAATAPGSNKSIMAIQRMNKNTESVDVSNMSDENRKDVGNNTQILAITEGNSWNANYVISESGVTNMSPKAAIDANGNWAVVWPAGEMKFTQTAEGSEPFIEGDLMLYSEGEYSTFKPQSVALLDSLSQINDFAVGISNGMPFVWATIPEVTKDGKSIPNVYGIINDNGIVKQMSLGIKGSNHQIIQLTDGRFIAASREVTDSAGVDVSLYEGSVENSNIKIKKLGTLGLGRFNVNNYKLFATRKGAKSASDLYVVWNQHDIEVLDAQTLAATSSNNCFVAQVTTRNGLGISYPTKLCTLKDEESVVNIDAFASDNNEVTALLCVTGAGNEASTGAYVLEIDSKIDNAVAAVEANLENTITKGEPTNILLTVRNEGHDPITALDADINNVKASANVNIKPGDEGTITVTMPAGADLTNTMNYVVNATFTNEDTKTTEIRDCGNAFSLEVADIAAELLYNQLDTAIAKSVITASVKNLTVGRYRDGYTVKAGIYLDANGHNLYPRTSLYEIPATEFTNDGLNSVPVNFLVPTTKEETMVYLIVQTVAEDGTVVQDQVKGNNIIAMNIEAYERDIPTEQEEIHVLSAEDFEQPLLKIRNDGNAIVISDIDTENDVKVYGPGGNLIHWTNAQTAKNNGAVVRVPNVPRGVILVSNGTRAGKILH